MALYLAFIHFPVLKTAAKLQKILKKFVTLTANSVLLFMKLWRITLVVFLLLTAHIAFPASGTPAWEHMSASVPQQFEADADDIDVSVRDGVIYITTRRQVNVKVLTILGQLISQQNIHPGVSRLKIPTRGIYILKIGSVTKRVTI